MTGPKERKSQDGEKDRRAQALRDNLRRRKAQARARSEARPKGETAQDRSRPAGKSER